MFGRPKFADGAFLLREIGNGLAVSCDALEKNNSNPSSTDTQAIMTWVFVIVLHPIMLSGRTDQNALTVASHGFAEIMNQLPADERWSLERLFEEIDYCQKLLVKHVSVIDYDAIKTVFTSYYVRLNEMAPAPTISQHDFITFGVTSMLANFQRLQNSGHIKR